MAATADLIDAAQAAAAVRDQAQADLTTAQDALQAAIADFAAKSQLVYDDLTSNGVALYTDPDGNYFIAAPVDPATFSLTPIRVA